MGTVTSKDGTKIAFDRQGDGPPVILVDGALCYRAFGPMGPLSALLAPSFTVINYDRRGRGESSDTLPYALEREVEDIDALIREAGGTVHVYGVSSGAALALEAAACGLAITRLALYEPPYNADPSSLPGWKTYRQQLAEALTAGRRGAAAALFMKLVGAPDEQLEGMRHSPMWPMFEAVAPTLAYDAVALGDNRTPPLERAASVTVPTLVMAGEVTLPFMHDTARALAKAIPDARYYVVEGQAHDAAAEAIAPVLVEFFSAD